MSQHDMSIANDSGAQVRADINAALEALVTLSSGASEPSTTFPGQLWWDTTNDLLKIRNGADSGWVTVASWDGTTWVPYSGGSALTYAEGSWTPAIAGGTTAGTQTYSAQVGRYIRVGNLVTVWFSMTMTAKDAATAGDLRITGLPFTSSTVIGLNSSVAIGSYGNVDLSAGKSQVTMQVASNTDFINLQESGDNVGAANLAAAALNATTILNGTLAYRIN